MGGATFNGVTKFGSEASFKGAAFSAIAQFKAATFGHDANFRDVEFQSNTSFEDATFKGHVTFDGSASAGTYFRSISFSRSRFLGRASFVDRTFEGVADFSNANFVQPPDFRVTEKRQNLDWTGVKFAFCGYLNLWRWSIPFRGWTTQSETVARLRRLRGIAKEIHAVDAERDLFILERQAERGILWYNWWQGGRRTWSRDFWRAITTTALMAIYRYSSNCGRSLLLPLLWLVSVNWSFYHIYAFLIDRPLLFAIRKALFDLTFVSAFPFGATGRPAFQSAVKILFEKDSTGSIDIPWQIQAASAAQGITNLVLLFLMGLALRNYFKLR